MLRVLRAAGVQVRVMRAFMPLLRKQKGRVVFMSSIAGSMAPGRAPQRGRIHSPFALIFGVRNG